MNAHGKRSWFVRHDRPARVEHRLFCFPYAGGNAQIFRDWAGRMPAGVELIAIQAPGKGSRLLETPCATLSELIAQLLPEITPLLAEHPYSFFGHSNGALVAFELACVLQERGLPVPEHLFLSASPAPWTRRFDKPYSEMDDDEFRTMLQDLDGTPPEVLQDKELFELVLPGLRADFSLSERYAYARTDKLRVPASIYYGEHDAIDAFQIESWQDQIAAPAHFERIPGGHFYIHSHLDLLTGSIRARMAGRTSERGNAPRRATPQEK